MNINTIIESLPTQGLQNLREEIERELSLREKIQEVYSFSRQRGVNLTEQEARDAALLGGVEFLQSLQPPSKN